MPLQLAMAKFRELNAPSQNMSQKTMPLEFRHYRGKENHDEDWVPAWRYRNIAADTMNEPTPTTKTVKVDDEDEDIALPTPILVNTPCTIISKDGRVATIDTPIAGFEHLFRVQENYQGIPRSQLSSNVLPTVGQPQQAQTPGASHGPHHSVQAPDNKTEGQMPRSSRNLNDASRLVNRKAKKRTRSGSLLQERPQRDSAREASDENEYEQGERKVVTERTYSFCMGDVEGLKKFFRQRIDELTMKPVRGMVTTWIKQLEPRRQGGYGPYHRKKPSEMPNDATPPWWPEDVGYIEPAHLDKAGLLELAVEVMLQHRPSAIDEVKRQCPRGWTEKLRSIAHFAVDNTPEEHFSSSKNPVFSEMMKERAMKSILPSLFEVSQTYEDYVHQHSLWNYSKDEDLPKGKTVTWQHIARPPKQISQRKRVRVTRTVRGCRDEPDVDAHDNDSDNDTEVDETMERLSSNNMLRRGATLVVRDGPAPPREPASKVSTSVAIEAGPSMMTANPNSAQSTPSSSFTRSTCTSSFDPSFSGLHIEDDVKGGNVTTHSDHGLQPAYFGQPVPFQSPGYMESNFHPMQRSNTFPNASQSAFASYPTSHYIDPHNFSLFHDDYTFRMGSPSLGPSLTARNMMFPYAPDGTDVSTPADASNESAHDTPSFNGLPDDFGLNNSLSQQQYSGLELAGYRQH